MSRSFFCDKWMSERIIQSVSMTNANGSLVPDDEVTSLGREPGVEHDVLGYDRHVTEASVSCFHSASYFSSNS